MSLHEQQQQKHHTSYQELNRNSVAMLVHQFYDTVREDPDLQPVFEKAIGGNWGPHLERMVDFWSTVMLGTRDFQGNVYGKHMLFGGVEPEHFRRWLQLFEAAAYRLFEKEIADEFSVVAHRIANSLQFGFFGKVVVA
ncbi:group III truncated hemoglobin [Undibacterium terreum]|uniref:Preprotein translocase subunit TatC n=1 Tax=Undibacterium terreum TaxID=1224302 RepID=A0A916XAG9_9BURK|nr:group III truncated hemoglobin [Undibacterium terreum]GGC57471.1 preprotein translocase subunit TatC [Undibacterium terreum]